MLRFNSCHKHLCDSSCALHRAQRHPGSHEQQFKSDVGTEGFLMLQIPSLEGLV